MQKKPYRLEHKAEPHIATLQGSLGMQTVVLYEDYATEVEQLQADIKTWQKVLCAVSKSSSDLYNGDVNALLQRIEELEAKQRN